MNGKEMVMGQQDDYNRYIWRISDSGHVHSSHSSSSLPLWLQTSCPSRYNQKPWPCLLVNFTQSWLLSLQGFFLYLAAREVAYIFPLLQCWKKTSRLKSLTSLVFSSFHMIFKSEQSQYMSALNWHLETFSTITFSFVSREWSLCRAIQTLFLAQITLALAPDWGFFLFSKMILYLTLSWSATQRGNSPFQDRDAVLLLESIMQY